MSQAPPPAPEEREPHVRPEDRPARVSDLRSLRRWLLVAAVWAAAATAIAVIALVAADDAREDNTKVGRQSARTTAQIADAQRRLDQRLDELEGRLDELASAEDLSDLSNRLERVEGANGRTSDQIEELTGSIQDLESRVESLEQASPDSAENTETTP
jgi:septal ring factor EnvC (AmiA/AmiB activator)